MVKQARRSGQLNLSNRGLASVPDKVWTLMELDTEEMKSMVTSVTMDTDNADNWWDTVDLTKLILACNKISCISPQVGITKQTILKCNNVVMFLDLQSVGSADIGSS